MSTVTVTDRGRTMTITVNWSAAADVIRERGWTQRTMQADDGSVCLTGACQVAGPALGIPWACARELARRRGHGERWNDADDRTKDEVLAWLDTAEQPTEAEWEGIYGPQWEHVIALCARVDRLTKAEAIALQRARASAMASAWDSARDSALDIARDIARESAWGGAWALVVRDLISEDGFTQEHYDVLTRPWRQVIGPVHPDDAPLDGGDDRG